MKRLLLLVLVAAACSPAVAAPAAQIEKEVSFSNGAVILNGTLMLSAGSRAAPVVVFLHGSGPATRAGARPYALEVAKLGVASLFFDKRKNWTTSSLDDLAGDALAAAQFARESGGVDPDRVGFWGVSQAAWGATLAASRSEDIALMILISGGGVSPLESEMYSYGKAFERLGLSADERAVASSLLDAYFEYLRSGAARPELLQRLDGLGATNLEPLGKQLSKALSSQENRSNWSWVADWDPAPHAARLRIPLLLMFGGRDSEHPTDASISGWRKSLEAAGNDRAVIVTFPEAGHGIRVGALHQEGRPPLADGYTELTLGWLWRHVVSRPSTKVAEAQGF